jgi:2-keto-4-pentenoate hydratase
MKIIARDNTAGTTVAENTGAATLGNPMNVVAWLIGDLKKAGYRLKAGDLISIGSFSPLFPVKAGQTVSVTYEGMAQPATVKVTFQ